MLSIPRGTSLLLLALAPLTAQEIKLPPNFGARATETVDVSLDSNMLQIAAKFLSAAKSDEAQAKKLIAGLKSIYVKSFEFAKAGDYNAADVETVRAQFRGPGWSRMVGVQNKKDGENSEVFLRLEKDGKIGGLGVVAAEAKELTIVSIVGSIDPEQLGELSGKFGIPKINLEQKKKTGKDD
jgi:Domain of unknown function (DUF4252)